MTVPPGAPAPFVPYASACVAGWPAVMIAEVLERNLEDHLDGRMPEDAKAGVRAAYDAIRMAARAWNDTRPGSACGTKNGRGAGGRAPSAPMDTTTAAETLGISERAVRKRAAAGSLSAVKYRGRWMVRLPDNRTERP